MLRSRGCFFVAGKFRAARRGRPACLRACRRRRRRPAPRAGPRLPRATLAGGRSPASPSLSPASRPLAVPSLGPGPLGSCDGGGQPSAGRSAGGFFCGVFSAPGAIPAERGSDAEPVPPGWVVGEEGRRAGVLLQEDATPDKSTGKQRSVNRNWSGGGRPGKGYPAPGAHPSGACGDGIARARGSGAFM